MTDVVIVGAGPNGLVAANLLADAGLEVVVCEEQPEPGGAVRSRELTLPGYVHDVFSAFYPFAAASPVIRDLDLESWGLRWRRAPLVLAQPASGARTVVLSQDLEETAASLDSFAPGDGDAWKRLYEFWSAIEEPFMEAFTTPFPPVRAAAKLAARLRPRTAALLAEVAAIPLRRFVASAFRGEGGGLLLGGNALHADLTPESPGSALFGLVLCGLGQHLGFPIPEGGAGRLTDALVRRLAAAGGQIRCTSRVSQVEVRAGRASGVRLANEEIIEARVGVLADVGAPQLYGELIPPDHVPRRVRYGLHLFKYDYSTIKLDFALSGRIPWSAEPAQRAGTIHVGESLDFLSEVTHQLEDGVIPARPFLILGQYSGADDSRAPAGKETAWAYAHVPQRVRGDAAGQLRGAWDEAELSVFAQRMEDEIERRAPSFRSLIEARHILGPNELEAQDRNLVGGALNGGTAKARQQLVMRPIPGLGRPETPVRGLYLASASAHPGGGVHGAPGAIAARAMLRRLRKAGWPPAQAA